MFEPGRLCVKLAGRDAGKTCVIVKKIDDLMVLIDGETRRRNCNIRHLEPLEKTVKLNKDASHAEVKAVFEKLGLVVRETKPKKLTKRTKKQHKKKVKPVKEKKEVKPKKAVKKVTKQKSSEPSTKLKTTTKRSKASKKEDAPKKEEKVEAKTSSNAATAYVKKESKKE